MKKNIEQLKMEVETLQWNVLGDRDKYSRGHASEDAQKFAKDWSDIRSNDREAAVFLAVEILKDAGLEVMCHKILSHWFGPEEVEKILSLQEESTIS